MQTFKLLSSTLLAASLLAFQAGPAGSFDADRSAATPQEDPRKLLQLGYQALQRGAFDEAVGAFRQGAEQNDLASQWKLARMLQTGDGVERDHLAAYRLYAQIADRFAAISPERRSQAFVASANVALGHYHLAGIPGTTIPANPQLAERFFYRAAALYHDAEAQYQLGRIYRFGTLGHKQQRNARLWLQLASQKGHVGASSELGEMIFYGEGRPPNRAVGLAMLADAVSRATVDDKHWIMRNYRAALERANDQQRADADAHLNDLRDAEAPETERVSTESN